MSIESITETSQFLTFKLGDELFAVNVSQVREVLDISSITMVPRAPEFMRGVINVRGSVVPVVDLRLKFGMTKTESTVDSRIVVMELSLDGDQTILGAMADSVHEVKDLDPEHIEESPSIGNRWKTEFINGIGKDGEEFIILLDIDKLFSTDELTIVQESSGAEKTDHNSQETAMVT